MKIGFIGVGTIASAAVNGFCMDNCKDHDIFLSPRNADKAAELAEKYENVTVCASNQEVVDQAEWIILAVIPKMAEEVIAPLQFHKEHKVVSFMSDYSIEKVKMLVGEVKKVVRVLPLPFAARRIGPVVLCPADEEAAELFHIIGNVVQVDEESKMETLFAVTGIMSAFYGLSWEVVQWGEKEGLSRKESVDYVTSFFEALCIQGRNVKDGNINSLANEYTPGGLNEMGLVTVRDQAKAYEPWVTALDAIIARLRK